MGHGTQARGGTLAVVFGDQLDEDAPLLRGLDPDRDTVLMAEVSEESTHVPSHVQRTVLFLAAMRHFAEGLRTRGLRVRYVTLDDPANTQSLAGEIARAVRSLGCTRMMCTQPGEWRVLSMVRRCGKDLSVPVEVLPDTHFTCATERFQAWAQGRASLTMEYFYREQRRATGYLMTEVGAAGKPLGGTWNFDKENRLPHGPRGPLPPPRAPLRFRPDAVTRDVIAAVRRVLPGLPGRLERDEDFAWPVTRGQALAALQDFVESRLTMFGPYQDAMGTSSTALFHSLLSPAMNLKLLNPRECCGAAVAAYESGRVPIGSAEAFVRQIIGWREFVRGIYWLEGPSYAERNSLDQHGALPEWYWSGETDMRCMRHSVGQVLDTGYGHHIQRLMVTGNFALTAGVHPKRVSDWYLGMFVDGVDWVTLPNALGMVMHADRRSTSGAGVTGLVGTKPYASSGRYIQRMSNYCTGCAYDPSRRTGSGACPFTVFYWDFLLRNGRTLARNQRMTMMLKNADAVREHERVQVRLDAALLRRKFGIDPQQPSAR